MSVPLRVRPLGPGDAAALAALFAELRADARTAAFFHPHALDDAEAAARCAGTGRDRYAGCFDGERLVAYGMVRGWDEGYDIPSFGVATRPGERRNGAGRRLLEWAVRVATEAGAVALRLTVDPANDVALEWYERAGFRLHEARPDGPRVYRLTLPPQVPGQRAGQRPVASRTCR